VTPGAWHVHCTTEDHPGRHAAWWMRKKRRACPGFLKIAADSSYSSRMKQGDVPRAVASGAVGSAVNDDRVRASRVAIIMGVFAAVLVFALYGVNEVPGRMVALVGGSPVGVARYGGVVASWQPPAGTDPARLVLSERSDAHRPVWHRDGDHYLIELPGVTEANAPDVIERLGARLEFREVIQSDALKRLVVLGLANGDVKDPAEPKVEYDQWHAETGDTQHDLYVYGHDRKLIEAAIAEAERQGWTPPPNTEIAYERIDPSPEAKDPRATWRTYFVSTRVEVDGADIENATGTFDPNTNRPIVLLDFTREGGRRFGDLTARIVGHKLATLLGGVIKSAPIIESPIRGGRASITMGAGDPRHEEHERDVLVETLGAGALSIGGTVRDAHWVAPQETTRVAIARIGLSIALGLVLAALAWLVITVARPERRALAEMPRVDGSTGFWKRLLWTLLAIAVYLAGTYLWVPGIDEAELRWVAHWGGGTPDFAQFTVFGLGIAPLVSAFVSVEIVASIVPRWRRHRDTVLGRRKLGLAVAIVAIVLSIVQAYFVVQFIESLGRGGSDVFNHRAFWIAVATYAAGPMILAVLASLIGSRGIGNGYAVLVLAIYVWKLPWLDLASAPALELVLVALVIVVVAVVGLALVSWRVRAPGRVALPLPSAGGVPLQDGGGALALIAALAALGVTMPDALADATHSLRGSLWIGSVALVAAAALWSFVFARPGRRRAQLAAAALEPASSEQWLRALVVTALGLACAFAAGHAFYSKHIFREFYDPALVLIAAVIVADLVEEWGARERAALIAIWPLHDPLLVDAARDRLTAASIPHFIQATRLRSLLWLFGSYVPMMVFVPVAHAEAAHVLMRDWLEQ
jgi:hypothetical protein